MRSTLYECKKCGHTKSIFLCDGCNDEMGERSETTIDVSFSHGSQYDGVTYHFCSDKCFKKWANNFNLN